MALILGIGAGLFVLILLWSVSILACVISSKLKAPLCYLGPGFISLCALVTATLFALPRKAKLQWTPSVAEQRTMANTEYDWTAYVVLPTYLALALVTLGASTGLLASQHLLTRPQMPSINSRRIHFAN